MTVSALHAAAREYARSGIPVFPISPGTKRPFPGSKGFHDATTDLAVIDQWWIRTPDANIAFCPESIGWCIVDADGGEGRRAWDGLRERHGGAPDTYAVETPRGGMHLYYRGNLRASVRRISPGAAIDTRGRGSYALLPPSVTPEGAYRAANDLDVAPVPAWLPDLTLPRGNRLQGGTDLAGDSSDPGTLSRARATLASWPVAIEGEGGDAHTYKTVCTLRDLGLNAQAALDLLLEDWNERCQPPWSVAELEEKVSNAYSYSLNEMGARQAGSPALTFQNVLPALLPAEPKKSRFHAEGEQEQDQALDPTWLVPDVLLEQTSAILLGQTRSYKSFLGLDLSLACASGVEVFGSRPVRSGPVFYAAAEGRIDLKRRRRMAWRTSRGVDRILPFYVMPAPMILSPEDVQEFGDEVTRIMHKNHRGERAALIVLDTVAKVMAGMNENDAKDAGLYGRFSDSLVENFRCSVLGVHHEGKDEGRGSRGSSAFNANADTVLHAKADHAARVVTVRVQKHKDAEERAEPWYFEGHKIAGSLAFTPIDFKAFKTLTGANDVMASKAIGATLRSLGAVGAEKAVTSAVLASAVLGGMQEGQSMDTYETEKQRTARALVALARSKLEAYAWREGRDIKWSLPGH